MYDLSPSTSGAEVAGNSLCVNINRSHSSASSPSMPLSLSTSSLLFGGGGIGGVSSQHSPHPLSGGTNTPTMSSTGAQTASTTDYSSQLAALAGISGLGVIATTAVSSSTQQDAAVSAAAAAAAAAAALMHPTAIKQEHMTNEDLLSSFSIANRDLMATSWMSTLNSQVGALASLKALMQVSSDATNGNSGVTTAGDQLLATRLMAAAAANTSGAGTSSGPSTSNLGGGAGGVGLLTSPGSGSVEDVKPLHQQLHHQSQSQSLLDMGKYNETRNLSTESMASTSSGAFTSSGHQSSNALGVIGTSLSSGSSSGQGGVSGNAESIPRKQDIQTDIRMNKGRFQLVRKRGRSEVWNLFGQVVDTLTGNRLPYVACYACKVLYTDTGGGTGNMTRHRCSVGNSYRSIAGSSSTDTAMSEPGIAGGGGGGASMATAHSSSSFDSVHNFGLNGPCSPYDSTTTTAPLQMDLTSATPRSQNSTFNSSAAREAFVRSANNSGSGGTASSGFVSASVGSVGSGAFLHSADSLSSAPHFAASHSPSSGNATSSMGTSATIGAPFMFQQLRHHQQQTQQLLHGQQQAQQQANQLLHPSHSSFQSLLAASAQIARPLGGTNAAGSSSSSSAALTLAAALNASACPPSVCSATSSSSLTVSQASAASLSMAVTHAASSLPMTTNASRRRSLTPNIPRRPSASTTSNITRSTTALQRTPPFMGPGYVFTQADKQLFAHAVVQFCAQDLHNYDVVEGEGFKSLIETVLFIGRRSHGDASSMLTSSFDPVRNLIPTARQMRQVFNAQDRYVRQATLADLSAAKGVGIALSAQSVHHSDGQYLNVSADYITEDWRVTRRCLGVKKCANISAESCADELADFIAEILADCNLEGTKRLLLAIDFELDAHHAKIRADTENALPDSTLVIVRNAKRALNQILHEALSKCTPKTRDALQELVACAYRVLRALSQLNVLSESLPSSFFAALDAQAPRETEDEEKSNVREVSHTSDTPRDYADGVFVALKFVREQLEQIRLLLEREGLTILLKNMNRCDWQMAAELETFLEPFYETSQIFKDSKHPHFQRILPEWYALIHECEEQYVSPSAHAHTIYEQSTQSQATSAASVNAAERDDDDENDERKSDESATARRRRAPPSSSTRSSSSGAIGGAASSAVSEGDEEDMEEAVVSRFAVLSSSSIDFGASSTVGGGESTLDDEEPRTPSGRRRPYLRDVHMLSVTSALSLCIEEGDTSGSEATMEGSSSAGATLGQQLNAMNKRIKEERGSGDDEGGSGDSARSKTPTPTSSCALSALGSKNGAPAKSASTSNLSQAVAESIVASSCANDWLKCARRAANSLLQEWTRYHMLMEHKIATVLNPRLKHLNLICSHAERSAVYNQIREMVGLNQQKRSSRNSNSDSNTEEPARKRREFLDRLEECASEDDELDAYLRASFPPNLTRNILEFWSSIGESEFPRLARLARFLLATSGACAPLTLTPPSTPLDAQDLNTLFILRPEVLNSLNRSPTFDPPISLLSASQHQQQPQRPRSGNPLMQRY